MTPTKYFSLLVVISFAILAGLPAFATTTPAVEIIQLPAGTLVKGSNPNVYVVADDGSLRLIPDEATFVGLGYSWTAITTIDDLQFAQYFLSEPISAVESKPTLLTPAETEARIREFFADTPAMISIAKCESGFRQFTADGAPLRGSNLYIGVFQIDEKIHADWAKQLGMDIYTLEGNLAYAKRLYEQSGTRPWAGCVTAAPSAASLTSNLKMGDDNPQVKILQQLLNAAGFTVAASGPGSAGSESSYFGAMTRAALQRFQCAKGIVCEGSESTTGYGLVGPKTRATLMN